MRVLPIVARELRLASRRRGTYWLRSGAALVMIAIGTWLFFAMKRETPRDLATSLFCILTGGAVLFALASGPRSTADCISEEKREGTLGLLFLTDLKGYDVVLGKLAAGSIDAFYAILAMLPMLAIPILLGGGITLGEFGRMALVAINALFFSLTLGICVSAFCRSAHKAVAVTCSLILFFGLILPSCAWLFAVLYKGGRIAILSLCLPSPGFSYYAAFDRPYRSLKTWYWCSIGFMQAASWACLLVASVVTPASWQDCPVAGSGLGWRERWRTWAYGAQAARSAFRQRLLAQNPVFWLFARMRSKPAAVWEVLALLALVWLWLWSRFRREWLNEATYLTTALILNFLFRIWFAVESTRSLAEQRKGGALELLLSTPLRINDILQGQWLALKRQFFGPVFLILVVESLFMFLSARDGLSEDEQFFWFALWAGGMLMLLADLATLYWLGMWHGLTAKNAVRAANASLGAVLVLPAVLYAVALLMIIVTDFGRGPGWKTYLGLWLMIGLWIDAGFGTWARNKLLSQFRIAAQQRYDATSGFWKNFGRGLASNRPPAQKVAVVEK